jgi:hypothetical protein
MIKYKHIKINYTICFLNLIVDTMTTPEVINLLLVLKQLLPCVAVHNKFGSHDDSDSEEEDMETDYSSVRLYTIVLV